MMKGEVLEIKGLTTQLTEDGFSSVDVTIRLDDVPDFTIFDEVTIGESSQGLDSDLMVAKALLRSALELGFIEHTNRRERVTAEDIRRFLNN